MREFKEEEKKKNWEKKKREKKKKREEKESVKKEENKKGSYQILRSEMEGRNTALKRRRGEKKKLLNGNSKKSWHSDKSWKHFLYLPSPIFILFPLLLPYITS